MIPAPPRPAWSKEHTDSVAHELNNVLTVIRTYTYFSRQPTTTEQRDHDLRVVAAAAERASALVDWLSSANEQNVRAPEAVSASEFVSSLVAKLAQLVETGTTLEVLPKLGDVCFRVNVLRLEHVMMSLVLAASQRWAETAFRFSVERTSESAADRLDLSVAQSAVLVVSCKDVTRDKRHTPKLALPPDEVAALVAPLSELLRTMQGKLEFVRSSAAEDRFEIYLPACVSTQPEPAAPSLALVPPGKSTVCIIEDETAIRLGMRRTLSGAGYFVIEANDGSSARELLMEHGSAVRLLICDVGLLRQGEEFFAWVRVTCPQAALLLISGSVQEGEAKANQLHARFLPKPFTPAELVAATKELVSRAGSAVPGLFSLRQRVVLIVDDEQVIRESLQRLLAECNFETVVASSVPDALQVLETRQVDAVVTDQFMPGLGGIHLLEQVNERYPTCVRVLCTGYPSSDVVMEAVKRGRVQRVLPKSMHAVALRDEIERAVLEGLARA